MQIATTNELSCSVFGHNLERSSTSPIDSHQLICKTCQSKVSVNQQGEFNSTPFPNRDIHTALRQLFMLKHQHTQRQLSV